MELKVNQPVIIRDDHPEYGGVGARVLEVGPPVVVQLNQHPKTPELPSLRRVEIEKKYLLV